MNTVQCFLYPRNPYIYNDDCLSFLITSSTVTLTSLCSLIVARGVYVKWVDNFSKVYASGFIDISRAAYVSCLWSVCALKCAATPVPFTLRLIHGARSMPDDLFEVDRVSAFAERAVKEYEAMDSSYWLQSHATKFNVTHVPVRVCPSRCDNPRVLGRITDRGVSLDNLIPHSIIPTNIGSNDGLAQIMLGIQAAYQDGSMENAQLHVADCNIFSRMLKVLLGYVCYMFYYTVT